MADIDVSLFEEEDDVELDDSPITQLDSWTVIKAYFDEKGLVRQQLDSFDQFITNTVTEVVEDTSAISLRPQEQYGPGAAAGEVSLTACMLGLERLTRGAAALCGCV